VCSSHNYVAYRLTDSLAIDYDTASIFGGIFDAPRKAWDLSVCEALGLDDTLLPEPRAVTDIIGHVSAAAAEATGLPPGIPVIAGTGDTFPTIVGCGAVNPGDAMIAFGTTGLLTLTTRPLVTAAGGPHFLDVADGGGGAVEWAANVLACGRLLSWFRDEFGAAVGGCPAGRDGKPDFACLDRRAQGIAPGSEGLVALPHLMGRRRPAPDPHARGVLFGLTQRHSAVHVYRSLLESTGYAIRRGYEPMRHRARRVIATAGGSASPLWRQIVADILSVPIEHHPSGSGALGIAYLAAYAVGAVDRFEAVRENWLGAPEITVHDPANSRRYEDLYGLYCHLDDGLAEAFDRLADFMAADQS
jgi:xylulokinase